MQAKPQQPSRVAAVFQDAVISLKIAHQTTFAQLAELLSRLAEIHGELMCPVQVRVPVPVYAPRSRPGPQAVGSISHLSNRRPGVPIYH